MPPASALRIDSHKLIFHPRRVVQWLDGSMVYPVYMEISPAGACNHRCTFCAVDYAGYKPHFLNTDILLSRLSELGSLGIASIMYAGEGEPLLHRDIAQIIEQTRSSGIDVAMTTNGVLLVPELAERILPHMSWLKVSINGGSPEGYAAIHRTRPDDYHKVFDNIRAASGIIEKNGLKCTLGVQAVLLPENAAEMELLARRSKDTGARYLVIKPYSQHHKSHTRLYEGIDYTPWLDLSERLDCFNDESFRIIFRTNTIKKMLRKERGYGRCLALPFWSYIDAAGNVWGCSSYLGDKRFLYGNIFKEDFRSIWTGDSRRQSLDMVASELDSEGCRMNCRMDEINLYLWELTHPGEHVNFI
jgi:radical SAM protein with 4Fe4S-binding SPASM domain